MNYGKDLENKYVLVLDGDRESALSIVRSLGRKQILIEVGSSVYRSLGSLSKYCNRHFIYPDPSENIEEFKDAILRRVSKYNYSMIIPVTDLTICPLMDIRNRIEEKCILAMASNEALMKTIIKTETYNLANELGIPIPKFMVVYKETDVDDVPTKMNYPLVIKPRQSKIWVNGKGFDLSVSYARDYKELKEEILKKIEYGPVIVQEYVNGAGVGLGLLASKGKLLYSFQYERLHEVPITGGASSYRISQDIDYRLKRYASLLMETIKYDGVSMVEFKVDRERNLVYLMEINGRFWGSLSLPIFANADFPAYLFDLVINKKDHFGEKYKVGIRCRQLSREIQWLKESLIHYKNNKSKNIQTFKCIISDTLRILHPADRIDTVDLNDIIPAIYDVGRIIKKVIKNLFRIFGCLCERKRAVRLRNNPKILKSKLAKAKTVLIICQGNIIRSPYAAALLAKFIENNKSIKIFSAGLRCVSGRELHPFVIRECHERGIDCSYDKSKNLDQRLLDKADVIFCMEIKHIYFIRKNYSNVRKKIFLLTTLAENVPMEIEDPIYKDSTVFKKCFDEINNALIPIKNIMYDTHHFGRQ